VYPPPPPWPGIHDREILGAWCATSQSETEVSSAFSGRKKYFGATNKRQLGFFLIRAEEYGEFYEIQTGYSADIHIILLLTRPAPWGRLYIRLHTPLHRLNKQQHHADIRKKHISMIDMMGSQADDVTFLGMSFNALSDTINTMKSISRNSPTVT
jgi:hypothetical protein